MTRPPNIPYPDLFDPSKLYRKAGTSSEAAAAAATQARKTSIHRKLFNALKAEPRTPDELAADLGLVLNTVRARCTDLLQGGYVVRTGEERKTDAGRWADVLAAMPDKENTD
jgi:hypothetical protein